ncbi:UDP-N-acetylglucosamine 2-epimerase (non-hydrolyzing) [Frigoribacterium sp. VKM Ac-1396]|uniref:non-hydrolyzing UDP-N-acetylglucosamine 2-epimerase n=1 Tax=Frigoribacterium sp. VKM Ac-1396 TaxID=2783821 RepID=UPI00188B24F7|nr:UDP-N-acetylglucosamine 2-epimerase (non-hydrolyzing) [Frigoribacterium sp. VKM Ac-1396]MBF4601642.1 UDP-N-acetylglucosamine 2-epimerase (non-hydrolyzing) [Frigoribacterium sp. VKM Ac-1396]
MQIMSVVGARPQFVKLAPMARALAGRCDHVVVHTGQHYDAAMSDVFFDELDIPRPDEHLDVGSAPHGAQTGRMLEALEGVLERRRPDAVLVYGDTNSTLAATLAAVKLGIPVAHLEAGLRSFNRSMPEEHNRVMTDHAADLCLAPTTGAVEHLRAEGLGDRTVLVGDVMTDVLFAVRDRDRSLRAEEARIASSASLAPTSPYVLATLHRPANTDDPERLGDVLDGLEAVGRSGRTVLLLAHPRLRARACSSGVALDRPGVVVAPPVGYPELVDLLGGADGVVTDSGGLQKEAFLLRRPCVTVRSDTEWPETVTLGWNELVGDRPVEMAERLAGLTCPQTDATPYGDGRAATRAVDAMLARFGG